MLADKGITLSDTLMAVDYVCMYVPVKLQYVVEIYLYNTVLNFGLWTH